jgi:hypothetical protein
MKVGFLGLLFLLFLGLKLGGCIAWSWLWVTAPLWVPLACVGGFFAIGGIFITGLKIVKKKVQSEPKKG